MREREPKLETKQEKIEDHSDIPLYEKLDEESQKFVVEVKELSEMSEGEFLEKHPEVKKLIEKSHKRYDKESSTVLAELLSGFKFPILPPEELTDKIRDIGTMWDLVRLHLLELKDFTESGQPDYHSRQTDYLVEKITGKIIQNFGGPSAMWGFLDRVRKDELLTNDTGKKLIVISKVINCMHEFSARNIVPPALYYLKDLWRYAIVKKGNISGDSVERSWLWEFRDFFSRLSNMNLRENTAEKI